MLNKKGTMKIMMRSQRLTQDEDCWEWGDLFSSGIA